jgi:peptidylprolyl isomerase/FKBP-type peptidyl-prolyl cis-trans isomerase FklB
MTRSSSRASLCALLAASALLAACGHKQPSVSKEEQTFLDNNRKEKGVTVLSDGLQYKVVASGPTDGPHPQKGDEVKVDYTGSLLSGSVFDSTSATGTPAVLRMDHLIPAWMEALPRMRPGDEWLIYAPPRLGYGEAGHPPVIPPNSVLVFDVKLLGVLQSQDNAAVKFAGTHQPEGPSLVTNNTQ